MSHRRIKETIGLRYADFAVVAPIVEDIRKMLQEHPDIDATQTLIVNFTQYGASSLDVMIYTFTKTTVSEGVSVAELVRSRCEPKEGDEDASLRALALELRKSVRQAQQSLRSGLAEAEEVLLSLRNARKQPSAPSSAARAVDGKKAKVPA